MQYRVAWKPTWEPVEIVNELKALDDWQAT